ncbi:recombinase family protein, partial [Klebsiella pneumoniae]|nr:recombinase family protein [Klebsiella pneumoniae]
MAFYGYARVSTNDQDLDLQIQTLRAAGCEIIRSEKASGTSRDGRTELQRHCCKVSDEAAFCLIQRPYISKTL